MKVREGLFPNGRLNADAVGRSAQKLAELFGITVPHWAKVLIGEVRERLMGEGRLLEKQELFWKWHLPNLVGHGWSQALRQRRLPCQLPCHTRVVDKF